MPEITALGWFHTALGIIAIASGAYTLVKYCEIGSSHRSGRIYLLATLITAATALGIFQHGFFGPAHVLAVMTLGALAVGTVAERSQLFGRFSRMVQAISYSATLLFHAIPAITDGLLRLPVGDPVLTSIEDPFFKKAYGVLLLLYLIGVGFQLKWIRQQP